MYQIYEFVPILYHTEEEFQRFIKTSVKLRKMIDDESVNLMKGFTGSFFL